MLVNGGDTGVRGGLSEGKRLFGKADRAAAAMRPELLARNFVLLRGANEITIEYSKLDPTSEYPLEILLDAEGYPKPVLRFMNRTKASGKVVTTVMIETKPPESFKPVLLGETTKR